MLTNIENRLEELFEMIEMMPQDKVEAAEKVRGEMENSNFLNICPKNKYSIR